MTLTLPGGESQSFTAVPIGIDDGGRFGGLARIGRHLRTRLPARSGPGGRFDLTGGSEYYYRSDFVDLFRDERVSQCSRAKI